MEREQVRDLRVESLISDRETSRICRLQDGRIVKVAKNIVFETYQMLGANYEDKLFDTRAKSIRGIISPISVVYNGNDCIGYTMEEAMGHSLNDDDQILTMRERSDLHRYLKFYKKIEEIVVKANQKGIVIPDLCTCDNIIFTPSNEIRLIDYDGMQIGIFDRSLTISTSLGEPTRYIYSPKYSDNPFHFTDELDKTSLTVMMFLWIFNVNLQRVGEIDPRTGEVVTLDDVFMLLGIEDEVFRNKVAANLSMDKKGDYLVEDLYRIANNYNMETFEIPFMPKKYIKKLTKKIEI